LISLDEIGFVLPRLRSASPLISRAWGRHAGAGVGRALRHRLAGGLGRLVGVALPGVDPWSDNLRPGQMGGLAARTSEASSKQFQEDDFLMNLPRFLEKEALIEVV
jgi:hypothetical protein